MFQFENINGIYLLLVIPILLLLLYLSLKTKKGNIEKLGSAGLIQRLAPKWSYAREWTKAMLFLTALSFLFLAWANPQWGTKTQKIKTKSSDIIIAMDISQSMMAEDITPNRLERAKRMASDLVASLRGNRIGLIYFAGSAYLQMPLTNDYAAAELFLKTANTNQAGTQGTAIADAIDLAVSAFSEEGNAQKAMIIISDGENHDIEAIQAAAEAKSNGTFIYTIGVGTEKGEFIPVISRGKRMYKKDKQGNPVRSKLNIQLMQDIAAAGAGEAYLLNEGDELIEDLKKQISKIEKQEVEQRSFTDFASYFQYFLAFGIFLIVLEFIIPSGKNNKTKHKNILEI